MEVSFGKGDVGKIFILETIDFEHVNEKFAIGRATAFATTKVVNITFELSGVVDGFDKSSSSIVNGSDFELGV